MAAGLPVLATDICGYSPHIERAGAGVLIPSPFSQKEFNRLLPEMLLSPRRPTWIANGQRFVQANDVFSLHARAADYIEAIAPCRC